MKLISIIKSFRNRIIGYSSNNSPKKLTIKDCAKIKVHSFNSRFADKVINYDSTKNLYLTVSGSAAIDIIELYFYDKSNNLIIPEFEGYVTAPLYMWGNHFPEISIVEGHLRLSHHHGSKLSSLSSMFYDEMLILTDVNKYIAISVSPPSMSADTNYVTLS